MMLPPVLNQRRVSDSHRGILSPALLLNYSRYNLKMFSDDRQKTEIVHKGIKYAISSNTCKLAWT